MRGGSAFKYDAPLRSRHPDPELDAQGPMRVESQKGSILQCGTTCASAHPLPRGCEGSKHASRKRRAHSDECSRPLTPSLPSLPASPVVSLLGRVRNPRPCSVRRRVVPQRRERGVQLVGERGAVLPQRRRTLLAQPAYATTRSRLQPCGGPSAAMLCKLCSLSASVTSAAASLSPLGLPQHLAVPLVVAALKHGARHSLPEALLQVGVRGILAILEHVMQHGGL